MSTTDAGRESNRNPSLDIKLSMFKYAACSKKRLMIAGDVLMTSGIDENKFCTLGIYYTISLAQGCCFNEGLYGPLPAFSSDYYSILFSMLIDDDNCKDTRAKEENYIVICLFYHRDLNERISYQRESIAVIFEDFLKDRDSIETIESGLGELKERFLLLLS